MFGLLLRSELLQGSAVRTWNCVLNIANFFRYKFNSLRQPVMPRTRRRHHSRSRSRSRSHSHDRDREPKRRRVESPDNSHHRRTVSAEKEVIPKEDAPMEVSDGTSEEESSPQENICKSETSQDDAQKEESATKKSGEKVSTQDTEEKPERILDKTITPKKISPKKVYSPMQMKKHEEKLKQRQEKEEQRRKEKEEREEQRRKEKEEKEELRRKEKEEREEKKRKEKEEREELRRKEKEEKEEQKRKEKEEKEEQKRKEKEEKEEQKRKEKEEKENKRQQEIDEKNKEKKKKEELILKEKTAFANFFRKSATPAELKKQSELEQTLAFMPFQVKSDMRLAPICRRTLSEEQKETLLDQMTNQHETISYLDELKKGKELGTFDKTWSVLDDSDDVQIIDIDCDIGEKVEEEPKAEKMRAKLLKFHENRRPAYFGTWRKKSKNITPRKPFVVDKDFFDYEVDSDDDWEEEEPGESLHGSDDEEKENDEKDDYEVDNEFFVPHGYLSDEEVEEEENTELSPETQKEKLKFLQEEFDLEMKSKTEKIKPRLIGCIWENKLMPKVQDAIHKFLEDRMMIFTGNIQIQKRDLLNTSIELNVTKQFKRKRLPKELVPDFLQLIHGNSRNQAFLVNEFYNYLSSKNLDKTFSKASLLENLKQLAKWRKCPEEGEMFNKYCWYVDEDIRSQYEVNLKLPNTWSYVSPGIDENGAKKAITT